MISIKSLKRKIGHLVDRRQEEFSKLGKRGNKEWFCELCFCLLTANSKAHTAMNIQKELGPSGFLCESKENICDCIRRNKHRFHNNKTRFIIQARKYKNIKDILTRQKDPREWLVKNIKGLGWKEASHFLRNVGYTNYAIIDRHILNVLLEKKIIKEKPKTLSRKIYLEIEKKLDKICKKTGLNQSELDMYLWYLKTGEVLK